MTPVCESYLPRSCDCPCLQEDMSFKQLRSISEPKRIYRSQNQVRTAPLNIDAFKDSVYYYFNFKSEPSTEQKRHKGYVRFIKPRYSTTNIGGKRVQKQLQDLPCIVDCDCKDYRYRWAWVNKQKRASKVGSGSLNMATNKAPFKTNPGMNPGLCKHLLAMSSFIHGQMTKFGNNEQMDVPAKLDKLLRAAKKYTISGDVRNPKVSGGDSASVAAAKQTPAPEAPTVEKPNVNPENSANRQNNQPKQESKQPSVHKEEEPPQMKNNLKKLQTAAKIIEELETSEIETSEPIMPDSEFGGVGDLPSPEQPESEGEEALGLLGEIRDLLQTLVGDETSPEDVDVELEEEPVNADEEPTAEEDFAPGDGV